jgi:hypothetical protein
MNTSISAGVSSMPRKLRAPQRLDPIEGKSIPEIFVVEQSVDNDSNHLL